MVEAGIAPNCIYENDETEESDVHDLVDDRAVPNISIPIQLHSTVFHSNTKKLLLSFISN